MPNFFSLSYNEWGSETLHLGLWFIPVTKYAFSGIPFFFLFILSFFQDTPAYMYSMTPGFLRVTVHRGIDLEKKDITGFIAF